MKRIIIALMAVMLLPTATAVAGNGFYIGGKMAMTSVMMDDVEWADRTKEDGEFFSWGVGPVFGYDFGVNGGPSIRLEGEALMRSGDDWSSTVNHPQHGTVQGEFEIDDAVTVLVNAWYDITSIPLGNITLKPFAGASAGVGIISYSYEYERGYVDVMEKEGTETAFIFGPGVGVRFDIGEKWAVDALARYLFSTEYDIDGEKYDAPMLDFNVGLAYKF